MRWKLDTGQIIEPSYAGVYQIFDQLGMIGFEDATYRPIDQTKGKESDFTILMKDGSTIKATLIKEPSTLEEWWGQNKVDGFKLNHDYNKIYSLYIEPYYDYVHIPKSWPLSRQIDAVKKLIDIYKD